MDHVVHIRPICEVTDLQISLFSNCRVEWRESAQEGEDES